MSGGSVGANSAVNETGGEKTARGEITNGIGSSLSVLVSTLHVDHRRDCTGWLSDHFYFPEAFAISGYRIPGPDISVIHIIVFCNLSCSVICTSAIHIVVFDEEVN